MDWLYLHFKHVVTSAHTLASSAEPLYVFLCCFLNSFWDRSCYTHWVPWWSLPWLDLYWKYWSLHYLVRSLNILSSKHSSRRIRDQSSQSEWKHVRGNRLHFYSTFPDKDSPKSVCQICYGSGSAHRSKLCAATATKASGGFPWYWKVSNELEGSTLL